MTYGLQIFNDNNFIQIDETYKNYAIDESGSLSVAALSIVTVNFTSRSSEIPLLFIRNQSASTYFLIRAITTNSFTVVVGVTCVIDWFTAWPSNLVPASVENNGLTSYDASGQLIFDSRKQYPEMRQIINLGIVTITAVTFSFPLVPSGNKPYICANTISGFVAAYNISTAQRLASIAITQPSSTQIVVQQILNGGILAVGTGSWNKDSQVIITDKL
jgi:hypothetical protein